MSGVRRMVFLAMSVAAMLAIAARADAQGVALDRPAPDPFAEVLPPEEFRRALDRVVPDDADLRAVLTLLYEDFRTKYEQAAADAALALREARRARSAWLRAHPGELAPPDEDFGLRESLRRWRERRDEIHRRFEDGVAEVLRGAVLERWRGVVRDLRRARLLNSAAGRLLRRRVDLAAVAAEVEPEAAAEGRVAGILDGYASEFDAALAALGDAWATVGVDPGAMAEEERRWELERIRFAVEEVNRRYVEAIAAALAPEAGARFRERVYRVVYPAMYRESPAEYALRRLEEVGVPAESRARFEAVADEYHSRQSALRSQHARAWERWETFENVRELDTLLRATDDAAARAAIRREVLPGLELWEEDRALNRRTCRRLRSLLDAAALERIPSDIRVMLEW